MSIAANWGVRILTIIVLLAAVPGRFALADENNFVLRDGSAWVSHGDGVYASTAPGANFKKGDTIWAGQGAYFTVGSKPQNMVVLKGEAKLSETNAETQLDLNRGKAFAILDDLKGQPFQIRTTQSVAAVRGTHFSVNQAREATEVATYQGTVNLYARRPSDGAMMQSVSLGKGQKSSVLSEPRRLESLQPLNDADLSEWSGMADAIKMLRKKMRNGRGTSFGIEMNESDAQNKSTLVREKPNEEFTPKTGAIFF